MITCNHVNINAQIASLVEEILATLLQCIVVDKLAAIKDITKMDNSFDSFAF